MSKDTVRIDINAAWLHGHPNCQPLNHSMIDFIDIVAEEANAHESDMSINETLLQDITVLEIKHDTYLMWWKTILIGVLYKIDYMQLSDQIDFICPEFWDDFINWTPKSGKGTKLKVSDNVEFECEGDIKISALPEFHTWLESKNLDKETINDFYNVNIYTSK